MPQGMGNNGFAQFTCPVTLEGDDVYCELQSDPLIALQRDNEIARRSVNLLLDMMEKGAAPRHILVKAFYRDRDSVTAPHILP